MRTISNPGKFEGECCILPYLYNLALAGADDETGDQESCGFYAWRFNTLDSSDFGHGNMASLEQYGISGEDYADFMEELETFGNGPFVIIEDADGFVRLECWKKAQRVWAELVKAYDDANISYEMGE